MKTIPAINVGTADAPDLQPAEPLPDVRLFVTCDGANYTVYEQGDTPPQPTIDGQPST
ncbi:hypothetical protein [Burkholderia gladioli]|uniref:hypothetical protein n=1 Tax=Burkholderia gladioli TaxID=28095 RepID=UPI003D1CB783